MLYGPSDVFPELPVDPPRDDRPTPEEMVELWERDADQREDED